MELIARHAVALSGGRLTQTTAVVDLDPQTEWIEIVLPRVTSVSSGIVWDENTTVAAQITIELDGRLYRSYGRSTGGIRPSPDGESAAYRRRWQLPSGYFGGQVPMRLGERKSNTYTAKIELFLLRGSTLTTTLQVNAESSQRIGATRLADGHSVAYDADSSQIEESGDGVISFDHTSAGTYRGAQITIARRGAEGAGSLDGALSFGGATINPALWNMSTDGVEMHSKGYVAVGQSIGASTLTNDLTDTTVTDHYVGIISVSGLHQTAPTGDVDTLTASFEPSPATLTLTGQQNNDLLVDFLMAQAAPTVGADQTAQIAPANTAFPTYYRQSTQAGSSGGVMSWTWTGDTSRAYAAVVLKSAWTFVGSGADGTLAGAATTIACNVAGVQAGDLVAVWAAYEDPVNNVSIAVSDGTTSFTADPDGKTRNGSGAGLTSQWHYLLASVATGTVTYTATFGASVTFRNIIVFVYRSPTGAVAFTDSASGSGTSAAIASGNVTTVDDGISFGGYGETGGNMTSPVLNGVTPHEIKAVPTTGRCRAWAREYVTGFTGQAAGDLDGSFDWTCSIIAFKAVQAEVDLPGIYRRMPHSQRMG